MTNRGTMALHDRTFRVKSAEVVGRDGLWRVEIETERELIDDEHWSPYLYHQGLLLSVTTVSELSGQYTAWAVSSGPGYPHPELGVMYVFGHHPVRVGNIAFGRYEAGEIELSWQGLCDVFWDAQFSENIPFRCECTAAVRAV